MLAKGPLNYTKISVLYRFVKEAVIWTEAGINFILFGAHSKTHIANKCPNSCAKTAKSAGSINPVLSVANIIVIKAANKKDM